MILLFWASMVFLKAKRANMGRWTYLNPTTLTLHLDRCDEKRVTVLPKKKLEYEEVPIVSPCFFLKRGSHRNWIQNRVPPQMPIADYDFPS